MRGARGWACAAALVAAIGVSACAPRRAKVGMLASWDKKLAELRVAGASVPEPGRTLAESNTGRCLKDRLALPAVREELERSKALFRGSPASGTFAGLNLSGLHPAEGKFLAQNASWTYAGLDYSGCRDLPCVINTIYTAAGNSSMLPGNLIYGWYLRTGYALATTDSVRSYEGPLTWEGRTYADYLFTERELQAFWRLSFDLPQAFWNLRTLESFHRLPPGGMLTRWLPGGGTAMSERDIQECGAPPSGNTFIRATSQCKPACGDAGGTTQWGFVRLSDDCLGVGDHGFFYQGVTHEIAHRIDYAWGRNQEAFSTDSDWTTLSGWRPVVVADPATGRVTESRWESDPAGEKFARDYAAKNPLEDWADSVSYFRYDPDTLKKASERKYDYVSRKVFGGRKYGKEGLVAYYEEFVKRTVGERLIAIAHSCTEPGRAADPGSTGRVELTFEALLSSAMVSCMEQALAQAISESLERLRREEYEACDLLGGIEEDLYSRVARQLNPELSRVLAREANLKPIWEADMKLRAELQEQVDPREAYLYCQGQASPEDCYDSALKQVFTDVAAPYAEVLAPVIGEISARYLAAHSYESASSEVARYFRQLFAGIDRALVGAASSRWDHCFRSAQPEEVQPVVSPFSGGARFVSARLLNCVNGGAISDIRKVRDRFLAKFGLSVFEPNAQAYTEGFLLPGYIKALHEKLEAAALVEQSAAEAARKRLVEELSGQLVQDSSWVAGAVNKAEAQPLCPGRAGVLYQDAAASGRTSQSMDFTSPDEFREAVVSGACQSALLSLQITYRLSQQEGAVWADSMSQLEGMLEKRTRGLVERCRDGYVGKGLTMRRKRRACVVDNWEKYELQAIQEWGGTPIANRIPGRKSQAKEHLKDRRKELQAKALDGLS